MAKHDIKITEITVLDGKPTVHGTLGSEQFTAGPFRWGSKMLMKVEAAGLDRGARIAVGHAAKKALREAQLELPKAELVRPRKAKVEAAEAAPEAAVPSPEEARAAAEVLSAVTDDSGFAELDAFISQVDAAVAGEA
jgi:hypothetical protein